MTNKNTGTIAVLGLGYVGLPLAVEFARKYKVIGFDINQKRIGELMQGEDHTLETDSNDLRKLISKENDLTGLFFTYDPVFLKSCKVYIITVPTPVDSFNIPDLKPIEKATTLVASVLKKGDIVIYESTVYPGCTEEFCVPVLENGSGLVFNRDFFCGYSPERINPGDKNHTITKIKKVTSGSTPEIANQIDDLYSSIITAGTHMAPSIKVAEAAKVIENAQRDINIAFVNELAKIFNLLNIDTHDVLEAAGTKWNFLPFKPGLVGGHCIGVDPYYLAQKAQSVGYHPEIILSGRRVNDSMGAHVADQVVKLLLKKEINIKNARILILGITFKENCTDVRNTKVVDIIKELQSYKTDLTIYDPWASCDEVKFEYDINCVNSLEKDKKYDAVILAVNHREFAKLEYQALLKEPGVLFDVKGFLDRKIVDARL
ncbi:MAG: nucleotide sugar dehydrogenase [Bacteroidota bacterium]|nr:nucleotide sugar dehydrogenase [Bacteroidota bacterium]